MKHACNIIDLGKIDYRGAYYLQKRIVEEIKFGLTRETILFCEHSSVITLGRTGKMSNLLGDIEDLKKVGIDFFKVDRGGDITTHEPGQITVYPIFDLKKRNEKDIHLYLNKLQEVIKLTLSDYNIKAEIIDGLTGVWVKKRKIASIGVGISHWITYHGLSVNVNNCLKTFSFVKPCGMDIEMTSLSKELNYEIDIEIFKSKLLDSFFKVFNLRKGVENEKSNFARIR
ncbi:MAG: lipoyl(octanoyl) transferase LipB [Candidatus Omnitrophota bacterium]